MTPLEKAARAIFIRIEGQISKWDEWPDARDQSLDLARAVLDTLEEPSEEMITAGAIADALNEKNPSEDEALRMIWRAMIAAAKEQK